MAEMTDLEIVKKCAERMGMKPDGLATKSVAYKVIHCSILAINDRGGHTVYDPLHDDAQAMALAKKFWLNINSYEGENGREYCVCFPFTETSDFKGHHTYGIDLNRAICECVARMP